MRRRWIVNLGVYAVATALLSAVTPAFAINTPEPGLWSIVTRAGAGHRDIPVRKVDRCITPEEAKTFASKPPVDLVEKDVTCKSNDYRRSDNAGTWGLHCSGNVTFDATVTATLISPQHYTIVFAATLVSGGSTKTVMRKVEGHRIGECLR